MPRRRSPAPAIDHDLDPRGPDEAPLDRGVDLWSVRLRDDDPAGPLGGHASAPRERPGGLPLVALWVDSPARRRRPRDSHAMQESEYTSTSFGRDYRITSFLPAPAPGRAAGARVAPGDRLGDGDCAAALEPSPGTPCRDSRPDGSPRTFAGPGPRAATDSWVLRQPPDITSRKAPSDPLAFSSKEHPLSSGHRGGAEGRRLWHATAQVRLGVFRSHGLQHRRGLTGLPRRPAASARDAVEEVPLDHLGLGVLRGGPHVPEAVDLVRADGRQGLAARGSLGLVARRDALEGRTASPRSPRGD